jgi:hypothetical protein
MRKGNQLHQIGWLTLVGMAAWHTSTNTRLGNTWGDLFCTEYKEVINARESNGYSHLRRGCKGEKQAVQKKEKAGQGAGCSDFLLPVGLLRVALHMGTAVLNLAI